MLSYERVAYNSIAELNMVIENLGREWQRTNPKYRTKQRQAVGIKIAS
jgi:hypothetical protein